MEAKNPGVRLELPTRLQSKLESFRRRVWMIKLAEGGLAALFGLLVSYLFVFVLDRVIETPVWLRAALLVIGAAGFALGLPWKFYRWVWRTRRLDAVAKLLRAKFPSLGDQLLGVVEFVQRPLQQDQSESLCRAAIRHVDEATSTRDFDEATPRPRHRRWAFISGASLAVVVLAFVVAPAAGINALIRWLNPFTQTERFTFARLTGLPDSMVVPYAEPFTVTAKLAEDTSWSPNHASARYGRQEPISAELASGGFEFDLPPQKEPGVLEISAGDAIERVAVEPMLRPELNSISAKIDLPAYLEITGGQTRDVRGGSLSLVKGSKVSLLATASRALAEASVNGASQPVQDATIVSAPFSIDGATTATLNWRDQYGLAPKQPFALSLQAVEDEAPTIVCTGLAREQVIIDEGVVNFQVLANDDFGVKNVGIVWAGIEDPVRNPYQAKGESIIAAGAPDRDKLEAEGAFSPKREGIKPQTLLVRLYAVDYFPDRERIYTPTYVLHVLSPEEHAIWMTRELAKWLKQATEVYEREQQLFQTNQELRALSPEELDDPGTRRRIETQASAEAANARRLSGLTASGDELLRQAAKNTQFNVATLETWAQMLEALKKIAQNRMPSVSDMLKLAATAPPSAPKPGDPNAQTKSGPVVGNIRDNKSGAGQPGESKPKPPVPSIADVESGFNKVHETDPKKEPSKSGGGAFRLPVTTVQGGGAKPKPQEAAKKPDAKEQVEEAVKEQEDLLAEFAKIADELQKLLGNLEGSTFVKRLKAASRKQLEVASDLNQHLLKGFGVESEKVEGPGKRWTDTLAERETGQSDVVFVIQQDLEAYSNRVQQGKFFTVLKEMRDQEVSTKIREVGNTVRTNFVGQSIAQSEYWADTLDRWAEQLVGPGCPNCGECKGCKGSLPPAVVLEVLRILEKEIQLRDETRALEQARPALAKDEYPKRAEPLAATQGELRVRVDEVVKTIRELPEDQGNFSKEIALLTRVSEVMDEARGILARPDTGPEAIAAETEVIELLLATRRCNPKGGGGGGASPGGGNGGTTDSVALANVGPGSARDAKSEARKVEQMTGKAGRDLPAEFRAGLDAYFSALESGGKHELAKAAE